MGDLLHTVPLLRTLRGQFPQASIELLVGPWNSELALGLEHVSAVHVHVPAMFMFARGAIRPSPFAEARRLAALRKRHYDVMITTANSCMADLLLWLAVDAGSTVGAATPAMTLYNLGCVSAVPYDSRAYEAERIAALAGPLGLLPGTIALEFAANGEMPDVPDACRELLERRKAVVVLAPGAGWPGKQWPADRFAALATQLTARAGVGVVVVGSRTERALGDEVAAGCATGAVNLAGHTTVRQLASVLRRARVFVGNDSGPLHLAAALGVPTVALFGPTRASKWAPRTASSVVVQKEGLCEGCIAWHPRATCLHDRRCMRAISVDEVAQAVVRIVPAPKTP
jgi:lipopolysaccharide heptosyltransferase II